MTEHELQKIAELFWKKFEGIDEYDARMKLRRMMEKAAEVDKISMQAFACLSQFSKPESSVMPPAAVS